jgi:hypothetical protein
MDISPLPPSVFHLSIGALEVGILVAVTLFGVINVQAVIYFKTRQPNEPAFLKVLVSRSIRLAMGFCSKTRLDRNNLASSNPPHHLPFTFAICLDGI